MSPPDRQCLEAINAEFYRVHAAAFAKSRSHIWPGWNRVLSYTSLSSGTVLDLGCGQGRFAALLSQRAPYLDYTGVDESAELLSRADQKLGKFICARLTPELQLSGAPFSLITMFGLLHHIPGRDYRRSLLSWAAKMLAPGGWLALSYWDIEGRQRGPDRYACPELVGLDPAALEPGDHLLYWGKQREGLRYCHHANEAEIEGDLRALPGLSLKHSFLDDGKQRDQNRYRILHLGR